MTTQRPGVRPANKAKRLLDDLIFDEDTFTEDIQAATAYALLAIAEALGDIALSARHHASTAAPTAETGTTS